MRRRIIILGSCLLLAACSTAVSKMVAGSSGKSPSPTASSNLGGSISPPTLPPNAKGWHRDKGIIDGGQVAGNDHACQNSYSDPYKNGWLNVCAGGKQDLSSGTPRFVEGAIWVSFSPDPRDHGPANDQPMTGTTQEYDAPNAPTWVKIVSITGNFLQLQREDGSTLTFNLDTNQFS